MHVSYLYIIEGFFRVVFNSYVHTSGLEAINIFFQETLF